jgi:hypothetical protein
MVTISPAATVIAKLPVLILPNANMLERRWVGRRAQASIGVKSDRIFDWSQAGQRHDQGAGRAEDADAAAGGGEQPGAG